MSQLTYTQDPAVALEGLAVDVSFDKDIITAIAQLTIPFGRAVVRTTGGAADDRPPGCKLPVATGEVTGGGFLGFAMNDTTKEQVAGVASWLDNDSVRIMRSGRIWMIAEDAVTLGAPVFVRFAAGTFPSLGAVRSNADTATAVALPGASFRSIAGAGELVVVEFRP